MKGERNRERAIEETIFQSSGRQLLKCNRMKVTNVSPSVTAACIWLFGQCASHSHESWLK